jgi:chromate transporter
MSEHDEPARLDVSERATTLRELALLFLKLGAVAFGGPAAHIAMMEDEMVRRRRWLGREKFLDLLGATNLIPGPNSTELAIHVGYLRGGWPGLVVAGVCFILPAALIVTAFAWAYVRYGSLPQAGRVLYGVKPVIIAVVLQALWGLGKTAVKTRLLAAVGLAAVVFSFLRVNELLVIFCAGVVVCVSRWFFKKRRGHSSLSLLGLLVQTSAPAAVATAAAPLGLWPLFLFFLKVGSVLFGSGYVLLAFLRGDLVERWHWLTNAQLLDAVAVGQITPGPVFTTATFIGYVLGGAPGAAVATLVTGADGRRDVRTGEGGPRRPADRLAGAGERRPAHALQGEFGVAGSGGGADRPAGRRRPGLTVAAG